MLHLTDRINGGIMWATGRNAKDLISMALYAAAIPLAFVNQLISDGIDLFVEMMWLVPDRRIESPIGDS